MKKFIIINSIILWIVSGSFAYSNPKKISLEDLKLLLENCADGSYIETTQLLVPADINYINSDEYKVLVKKIKNTDNEKKKISFETATALKLWWDNNPIPKRSDYIQEVNADGKLDWAGFYEDLELFEKKQKIYVKEITKKQNELANTILSLKKTIKYETEARRQDYTKQYISNMSMSEKIEIQDYLDNLTTCEQKYYSTPVS